MIENGVKDLPSSMVSCLIDGEEAQILELGMEGFIFRIDNRIEDIQRIQVNYFFLEDSVYEERTLQEFQVNEIEEKEFFYVIEIKTNDNEYRERTGRLLREYGKYITCKSMDDSYCASEIAGYPVEFDETFMETFEEQRREWFEERKLVEEDKKQWIQVMNNLELAIAIDRPDRYTSYMEKDWEDYCKYYWEQQNLEWHPISKKKVGCIYIGNTFCHKLFPKEKELFTMMEKARNNGTQIVVVFSYLRDCYVETTKRLLERLEEWCTRYQVVMEIVVNDLGLLQLLVGKEKWFKISLGELLNKRRKDPRLSYKLGYEQQASLLKENALNTKEYQELLDSYGVQEYEYESCSYPIKLNNRKAHLHFPYYQTNTSQYCTLYAKCHNGDRGKQKLVKNCPYYCREWVFLYPKHLKMVGYYNTLFGLDDQILKEYTILQAYVAQGLTRIVSNLL
ncbi:hypothetical protein [Anaerosporobacter faecicola]|uniref:hypothetical protein n=1 Tax=Anaerosporobacter faecicola TaxID=2718714 RepID=UPI00143A5FEB|nr:hypothetical protein [Anaerosporobacter faecicola]